MNAVRSVIRDLVDRKLWPVALLLVVALVAVPKLLGSGEEAATTASSTPQDVANPATPATPGAGQDSEVTLVTPAGAPGTRKGRVRNPFTQPAGTDDDAAADAGDGDAGAGLPAGDGTTSTPGADTGTGGAGGADPSPGSSDGSGSGGSGGDATPSKNLDIYRVDLRFGTPGELKVLRDVARLAPLPSADNPFFVFLGVLEDRETLVFLLSSDVTATGDGTCRPSSKSCQTIELKTGDTEFFDFAHEDGTVIQYQMDVLKVDRRDAATAKAAAASYARKSSVGQELLRFADNDPNADAFDAYRFRPDRGVLVRAKHKTNARGAVVRRGGVARTLTRKGEVRVWRTQARAAR